MRWLAVAKNPAMLSFLYTSRYNNSGSFRVGKRLLAGRLESLNPRSKALKTVKLNKPLMMYYYYHCYYYYYPYYHYYYH